jgi:hypothetical protein
MDNYLFKPKSVFDKKTKDTDTIQEFFTLIGMEDFIDEVSTARIKDELSQDKIFAKKITRKNGNIKYMIRLANNAKLYNPISIYGKEKGNVFLDNVCRSDKKFKEVNEKTFNWYIKFLNTKNISWLNNAERESE